MSSLRSLATDLGLSITTVSRALDGYEDVSEATKARVRNAAKAAGYRPNPTARRLRKGSSEAIALVMPTEPGRFYEPAFVELLAVVGEKLAAQQHDLVLMAARPGAEEVAAYQRIIADRRADACILVRTRKHDPRVTLLQDAGMPFVCHGRTESDRAYAFVDGDGFAGFRDVTQRLIALGHTRIAHFAAPEALSFAGYRSAGWEAAMREADLATDLKVHVAATEEAGADAARQLLAASSKPTAIVCATDRLAIGAHHAVQAAGMQVGRDIAITGHDNIHATRFVQPALTTMDLDVRQAGASLVAKLFDLIGGASPEGRQDIFALTHHRRGSSGEAD